MFQNKIKFLKGCGSRRRYGYICISKNKCPSHLLQMVNWSSFRQYHCFYYHNQCLRTKIKVVWGCGGSRQSKSISISKNKAPLLLLQRVKWSPFRHYHYVYYLSQCLRPKIKFVFGGVVVADSRKVFPFLKIKPLLYYFKGLTGAHLDITIVFTITVNVCEQK